MIRNLKVLVAVAMALAAFGAVSAASAQAVSEFHCSFDPCTVTLLPDAEVNAHHVLVVENEKESVSTTCNEISGHATFKAKATASLTFTNIKYFTCKVAGAPSTVRMNECSYLVRANGTIKVECSAGKEIEIEVTETGCIFKMGSQEPPTAGITYKNIGSEATTTTEVTASTFITSIKGTVGPGCPIAAGPFSKGRYTTGNTKMTSESDATPGTMANGWWTA